MSHEFETGVLGKFRRNLSCRRCGQPKAAHKLLDSIIESSDDMPTLEGVYIHPDSSPALLHQAYPEVLAAEHNHRPANPDPLSSASSHLANTLTAASEAMSHPTTYTPSSSGGGSGGYDNSSSSSSSHDSGSSSSDSSSSSSDSSSF